MRRIVRRLGFAERPGSPATPLRQARPPRLAERRVRRARASAVRRAGLVAAEPRRRGRPSPTREVESVAPSAISMWRGVPRYADVLGDPAEAGHVGDVHDQAAVDRAADLLEAVDRRRMIRARPPGPGSGPCPERRTRVRIDRPARTPLPECTGPRLGAGRRRRARPEPVGDGRRCRSRATGRDRPHDPPVADPPRSARCRRRRPVGEPAVARQSASSKSLEVHRRRQSASASVRRSVAAVASRPAPAIRPAIVSLRIASFSSSSSGATCDRAPGGSKKACW